MASWLEVCTRCGRTWRPADLRWRCSCGGLLDLTAPLVDPVPDHAAALPPGAGVTAATRVEELAPGLYAKADCEQPTGSFKDRGAAAMIGWAARAGVTSVVTDSSGNAGRAVAAYAAKEGMACTVFVPAGTAAGKLAQIAGYGATVVEAPGGRAAAATAAQEQADAGSGWYASHVYQPAFHHGVMTLAFELYEQVPDVGSGTVVVPAGNGTLVLGLWLGFGLLAACGRIPGRPAIVAVQAQRCAPLLGLPVSEEPTIATGIAIASPPRAGQVRAAVRATGGELTTVTDDAVRVAQAELAAAGFDVEPTGAVAWAGRPARAAPPVAAVLTGR